MQETGGLTFRADFGKTATDYANYRVGFPASFFARLFDLGIGLAGQRAVDLGKQVLRGNVEAVFG